MTRLAVFSAPIVLVLATASAAVGAPPPAIAQYVETVPTSNGSAVVGTASGATKQLPPRVQEAITAQAGNNAQALTLISTSAQYGAPQTTLRRGGRTGARSAVAVNTQAMVDQGGGTDRLFLLLGLLLAATGILFGPRLLELRRRRN